MHGYKVKNNKCIIKGRKHQKVFPAEIERSLLKDVLAFEPEALVSGMPVKIMWDA
jgi:hypothetical protein